MNATSLRQLTRDFALGKIGEEEYRSERAGLLNGIASGRVPLVPFEAPETATAPVAEQRAPETAGEQTLELQKRGGMKWIAIAAAVLVAGGSAAYFFARGKPPAAPKPAETQAAAAHPASAAANLIQAFLERRDWGVSSLDQFFASWVQLDLDQRKAAAKTPLFKHFSDETYSQIVDEQTLIDLGNDPDAVAKRRRIVRFAADMGFEDPRFKEFATVEQAAAAKVAEASTPAAPQSAASKPAAESANAAPPPEPAPVAAAATPAPAEPPTEAPASTAAVEPPKPAAKPVEAVKAVTAEAEPVAKKPPEPAKAAPPAPEKPGTGAAEKAAVAEAKTEAAKPAASKPPPVASKEIAAAGAETAGAAATAPKPRKSFDCRPELANERRPFCRDALEGGGGGPIMVVLPPGTFPMGGDVPNGQPVHKVNIPHSFAIAMQEISFGEFEVFCKATGRTCPSQPWSGADYPVVNVSWDDAVAYADWLSKATGHHYRLPTEAEWEYSARAGSTGRYPSGDELLPTDARFSYQRDLTSPLPRSDRTINRNRFRLYNMLGNVREWVQDGWHDSYQGAPTDGSAWTGGSGHVVRGGSYRDHADKVQSASRELGPAGGDRYTGFRVVQELPGGAATSSRTGPSGTPWVAEQGQNKYTLQLFAVKDIARVERIINRHPRLEIMIMPSEDPQQPYRVYYGIFDTRGEARVAYEKLPRDILLQVKKPLLRSFAQIKSSLVQR